MKFTTTLRKESTLPDGDTVIIAFGTVEASVSLIVSDSSKLSEAQVTNSKDPNGSALWSDIAFTSNGAAISGPVTGIKLTADGADVDYSVVAVQQG